MSASPPTPDGLHHAALLEKGVEVGAVVALVVTSALAHGCSWADRTGVKLVMFQGE